MLSLRFASWSCKVGVAVKATYPNNIFLVAVTHNIVGTCCRIDWVPTPTKVPPYLGSVENDH
jgi:hypothetical protein